MTQFLKITNEAIQKSAATIRKSGIVVYPTDTVYGLGCDPFDEKAVSKLATVKQRHKGNFPVLVDSAGRARELGDISRDMESLVTRFWPGPLTIVVPCKATLPIQVVGPEKMIGLRIPRRPDALDLISQSGGSLLGTSANLSGRPPLREAKEAFKIFQGKVDIVLDGGSLSTGIESTVVMETRSGIHVIREGAIGREELRVALPSYIELQR